MNEELLQAEQQMIEEKDAALEGMSEEEKQAYLEAEAAYDRLMCLALSKQFNANIRTIDGDRHHISVNGQVMGYISFARWMEEQTGRNTDDEEGNHLGFFKPAQ